MTARLQQIVTQLEQRRPLQALLPMQIWEQELDEEIASLPLPGGKSREAIALRAGLHLLNDSLDRAHSYAQLIEDDPTGAYWHGIMHRMEADYWNAKYWFRQAGSHPVMKSLGKQASPIVEPSLQDGQALSQELHNLLRAATQGHSWNAAAFVDAVALQEQGQRTEDSGEVLKKLQRLELSLLLAYTLEAAQK